MFIANDVARLSYLQQFERLFQFARRIEDMMLTNSPEEVSVDIHLYVFQLKCV